jgi:hypothetical protein
MSAAGARASVESAKGAVNMRLRTMRIGAVLVLLAVGGACGDDDSDSNEAANEEGTEELSEAGAPTKAEYMSKADAICADYLAQSDELTEEAEALASEEPDPVAVKDFMDQQLGLATSLLEDVRALNLPDGQDGTDIEAALDAFEKGTDALGAEIETPEKALAFLSSQMSGEAEPSAALQAADEADAQAAALGFQTCFSGGGE